MGISFPKERSDWHHAYVTPGVNAADITESLADVGIATSASANFSVIERQVFSIADARALRERASHFAAGEAQQFFIIDCADMTAEAQNALLKLFEEPTGRAVFFLVVPNLAMLLPTLRSRMELLVPQQASTERAAEISGTLLSAADFMAADRKKRLELVQKLLPKKKTDEKDLRGILVFLAELEHAVAQIETPEERAEGLRVLYRTRRYITDRGASHKILLEQVALLVPETKR